MPQQKQRSSSSDFLNSNFLLFKISGGLPSLPGAFPLARESMTLLNSAVAGDVSYFCITGRSEIASSTVPVIVFWVAYSSR